MVPFVQTSYPARSADAEVAATIAPAITTSEAGRVIALMEALWEEPNYWIAEDLITPTFVYYGAKKWIATAPLFLAWFRNMRRHLLEPILVVQEVTQVERHLLARWHIAGLCNPTPEDQNCFVYTALTRFRLTDTQIAEAYTLHESTRFDRLQ